jgi:hypothetical protein
MNQSLDREKRILYGAKVIGVESVNGRLYDPRTLSDVATRLQGSSIVCNLNHVRDDNEERDVSTRFGIFRNFRCGDDGGLYADLHYSDHPYRQAFEWFIENEPTAFGFSIDGVTQSYLSTTGQKVVTAIPEIRSIDLVADPATTISVYESMDKVSIDNNRSIEGNTMEPLDLATTTEEALGKAVLAILRDTTLAQDDKKAKIMAILKLMDEPKADAAPTTEEDKEPAIEEEMKEPAKEGDDDVVKENEKTLESLRRQVDNMALQLLGVRLAERRNQLIETARKYLPDDAISPVFVETLEKCKEAVDVNRLIADRVKLFSKYAPKRVTESLDKSKSEVDNFVDFLKS